MCENVFFLFLRRKRIFVEILNLKDPPDDLKRNGVERQLMNFHRVKGQFIQPLRAKVSSIDLHRKLKSAFYIFTILSSRKSKISPRLLSLIISQLIESC